MVLNCISSVASNVEHCSCYVCCLYVLTDEMSFHGFFAHFLTACVSAYLVSSSNTNYIFLLTSLKRAVVTYKLMGNLLCI